MARVLTSHQNGGIKSIEDYQLLYEGQWKRSIPEGVDPGFRTNVTQDLFFAMERLSTNPYILRRLNLGEAPPFQLDDKTALQVAAATLGDLHAQGRLFVADHSYQKPYPQANTSERFTGFCTAYFYIPAYGGDLTPLAIKTNAGADLVYTPLDSSNDWTLAKMAFNVNDFAHSQFVHVANSHAVGEIVYQAAIRTLSDAHPIMVLMKRIMRESFAYRPVGERKLFAPGGLIDTFFALNNRGASQLSDELYAAGAGAFRANYFATDLRARGLIDSPIGPPLAHFPYAEDASRVHAALHTFFTRFAAAYYPSPDELAADTELQAWAREANGPAQVLDFPDAFPDANTLVEALAHFAFLAGAKHHVLNTATPMTAGAVLPFKPMALYAPLPEKKGVADLLPFLTPAAKAVGHLALVANFVRPRFRAERKTLAFMFEDEGVLQRLAPEVGVAAGEFKKAMEELSGEIGARGFGADGLAGGLPFVYKRLDPLAIPFFYAI